MLLCVLEIGFNNNICHGTLFLFGKLAIRLIESTAPSLNSATGRMTVELRREEFSR